MDFVQEKNRVVLRNLSIVTRQLASKVTERAERNRMIEESIQFAKQAVELDVQDGASWCMYSTQLKIDFKYFNVIVDNQIGRAHV